MITREIAGRRYLQFERLAAVTGLRHGFTTRPEDVSARCDARSAERDQRRRRAVADLGLPSEAIAYCVQVHTPKTAIVESPPAAPLALEGYDGAITASPNCALMTFSADCPLVLVVDPLRHVVGMIHASWRCAVADAAFKLVRRMQAEFDCEAGALLAGVGPSAGPSRYEVKDDVYDAAAGLPERELLFPRADGRMYFDLWRANALALRRAGIPEANIEIARICTMSRTDLLYSFRREGAGCGHFGLIAGFVDA